MRAIVLAALLAAPALAGCIASPIAPTRAPLDLGAIQVPEGATLEAIPGGALLRWAAAQLPFAQNVTIPSGVTLARVTAFVAANQTASVGMVNAETGRRRCNGPFVEAWDKPLLGRVGCAGLTAVDPLPALWTFRAGSLAAKAAKVEVELLRAPLDGPAALLDLAQLTPASLELEKTQVLDVPSFDGAPLHLEVTLPKGPGPWPVILASSPYNHADRVAGRLGQWTYFVQDWAKRGYAVAMADVRGFGESGGCVNVWGTDEQKDQAFLVDWASKQPWSNGKVGFYGQSYVGTTPVEASVQAPEALKAIVTIAPVINAYDDWHFGGVPNGEGFGSVQSYQLLGTEAMMPPEADPVTAAEHTANGLCDPALLVRQGDPRAIYDDFYVERNFSARASAVKAAVLYTQGFEDSNVKSAMITHWFNALSGPKLGLFGHWIHQHPTRADQEVLFLAWMEQHVKGKPLGLERLAAAYVLTNEDTQVAPTEWPPRAPQVATLFGDPAKGALQEQASEGQASIVLVPDALPEPLAGAVPQPTEVVLKGAVPRVLHLSGQASVRVKASLQGLDNAHLAAYLYDEGPEGKALVTWGMVNLAHRMGHERYEPVPPGEAVIAEMPLLPTAWVLRPGHDLRLVVRAAHVSDWYQVDPGRPGVLTLHGGQDGLALLLPLSPIEAEPMPLSAGR